MAPLPPAIKKMKRFEKDKKIEKSKDMVEKAITDGRLAFEEKKMKIDTDQYSLHKQDMWNLSLWGSMIHKTKSTVNNGTFPDSSIKLHDHEVRQLASFMNSKFGSGVRFLDRIQTGITLSDAVGYKGCRELEGTYAEFLESFYGKPFLLSGPVLPEPPTSTLEEKWAQLLSGFKPGSVIYCAFGSEWRLIQNQFKELLLGLELTGFPFLAALKAPIGFDSVEEAMPEGFKERAHGRGIVHEGWFQQTLILDHPSIGCFMTHCGASSLVEALVSKCQIVMLSNILDQIFNARLISSSFKAGVEVEKGEEDGLFTKESVCKAVKAVMDDESEIGREARKNHLKLRNILISKDLENTYIDSFCHKLQELLG
ncbi:UDP-glycosyltransferase 79B30 [Cajanus cajan]|uniref:UDP-glycosyltransferase 79B30 n=1 Tax=Cajanus cajan TaxID=3821 RepID=UPI00098DA1CC|nr:UDP-glycosyltransferase 79B30 [Cajanus cajan]